MDLWRQSSRYYQALERQVSAVSQTYHRPETVTLRQAITDDAKFLLEMHHRLSPGSLNDRYLRPYVPSFSELVAICNLLPNEGVALVAAVGEPQRALVGMAYFVRFQERQNTAEPAILIEDAYQGQGLGRRLFSHLISCALANDVRYFDAFVHPANARAVRLLLSSAGQATEKISFGLREIIVELIG